MFNAEFFNYEICVREPSPALSAQQRYFYIDDGPYFRNLSHLVEHYSKYEDGLPGLLLKVIRPNSVLLPPSAGPAAVQQFLTPDFLRGSIKSSQQHNGKQIQQLHQQPPTSSSSTLINSTSSSSSSSSSSVSNHSTSQNLILNHFIKV